MSSTRTGSGMPGRSWPSARSIAYQPGSIAEAVAAHPAADRADVAELHRELGHDAQRGIWIADVLGFDHARCRARRTAARAPRRRAR